jgi:biotin carboxyl carrier protein
MGQMLWSLGEDDMSIPVPVVQGNQICGIEFCKTEVAVMAPATGMAVFKVEPGQAVNVGTILAEITT